MLPGDRREAKPVARLFPQALGAVCTQDLAAARTQVPAVAGTRVLMAVCTQVLAAVCTQALAAKTADTKVTNHRETLFLNTCFKWDCKMYTISLKQVGGDVEQLLVCGPQSMSHYYAPSADRRRIIGDGIPV